MKYIEFIELLNSFKEKPVQLTNKSEIAKWTGGDWCDYYYVFEIGDKYRADIVDRDKNMSFGLYTWEEIDVSGGKKKVWHSIIHGADEKVNYLALRKDLWFYGRINIENPFAVCSYTNDTLQTTEIALACDKLIDITHHLERRFDITQSTSTQEQVQLVKGAWRLIKEALDYQKIKTEEIESEE